MVSKHPSPTGTNVNNNNNSHHHHHHHHHHNSNNNNHHGATSITTNDTLASHTRIGTSKNSTNIITTPRLNREREFRTANGGGMMTTGIGGGGVTTGTPGGRSTYHYRSTRHPR
uniref:Uncharacterized protein n=1 Tax=Bracon brevicornis TaxID=1563983 RepID=A0A6V7LA13_9HYME